MSQDSLADQTATLVSCIHCQTAQLQDPLFPFCSSCRKPLDMCTATKTDKADSNIKDYYNQQISGVGAQKTFMSQGPNNNHALRTNDHIMYEEEPGANENGNNRNLNNETGQSWHSMGKVPKKNTKWIPFAARPKH